ncbi:type II toxin-antitoxin system RelE/ParE family toxin [Caulobacter sp. LARHSG274]
MPPATLSATARRDMMAVALWIARDSRKASFQFKERLRAALIRLGEYPQAGVTRPEMAHEVYRFAVLSGFPYVLVYNSRHQPPVIMRILHESQDLREILSTLPSPDVS